MGAQLPLPQRGTAPPIFGPYLLWLNGCMDQDATWFGGSPQPNRLCVRWGPHSPSLKRGQSPQIFGLCLLCQTAGWIKMALGMEVGLRSGDFVLDGDPVSPPQKRSGPFLLWPNGWMHQDATWYRGRHQPRGLRIRWGPCLPIFGICYRQHCAKRKPAGI